MQTWSLLLLFTHRRFLRVFPISITKALFSNIAQPQGAESRKMSVSLSESLQFDNRNLRSLPIDPITKLYVRKVPGSIFSRVNPTPIVAPKLVAASEDALKLLGVDLSTVNEEELVEIMSGNKIAKGSVPAAHCYCGHQFGNFAGQLGDGAAISLGEVINPETHERWELQLKGAGLTPYSRSAEGRKVLRSSIREFLCSEHMAALGIPTTRAGTITTSFITRVDRDPFYDGHVVAEPCAVVSRVAEHFFRFGSFELILSRGPSPGDKTLQRRLFEHIATSYFAEQWRQGGVSAVYEEIALRTARLVALWQGVGWVHGVLNTDNMSIAGVTIDYGPFGFLEAFHNDYTPNGSDHGARYAYCKQSSIVRWNLMKLGEALKAGDLIDDTTIQSSLALFDSEFKAVYNKVWRQKLGLLSITDLAEEETRRDQGLDAAGGYGDLAQPNTPPTTVAEADHEDLEDETIVSELLETMQATGNDFIQTFMVLTTVLKQGQTNTIAKAEELAKYASTAIMLEAEVQRRQRIHRPQIQPQQTAQLAALIRRGPEGKAAMMEMFSVDEDGVQDIITEILGEESKLKLLSDALSMSKQAKDLGEHGLHDAAVQRWLPWLRRYEARLLALQQKQSEDEDNTGRSIEAIKKLRIRAMERRNPTVVLRAWMAQKAIEQADTGDFTGVRQLLKLLQRPFDRALEVKQQQVSEFKQAEEKKDDGDEGQFLGPTPANYQGLYCTCSS
jgi:uncharacterized protein YdiU (UPF0061 family)